MRTVVGIDPSLADTGLAIAEPGRDITTLRIRSKGAKADTWAQRSARLQQLATRITDKIPNGALVMIEAPSYASSGGAAHDRSGLWWALYQRLAGMGCLVLPVAPAQRMMYATGKGRADKDAVLAAAVKRYPDLDITNNNVADAVVLLGMGKRLEGAPIDALPQTHIRALDKIIPEYRKHPTPVPGDDPTLQAHTRGRGPR